MYFYLKSKKKIVIILNKLTKNKNLRKPANKLFVISKLTTKQDVNYSYLQQ